MKKVITLLLTISFTISISIFIFTGCSQKHDIYNIDTELGDHLTVEVYLSGNIDGLYLTYDVYNKNYEGLAFFSLTDSFRTELPEDPLKTFETIGAYGNTHFYTLKGNTIYVYNGERIDNLPVDYDIEEYKSNILTHGTEYMEMVRNVISDLMKTGNFEYIYQYGSILAYEQSEEVKQLLDRYASGAFCEEELTANENSEKTTEEMTEWAKEMLEQYFSS